jgi:hypothetical protein
MIGAPVAIPWARMSPYKRQFWGLSDPRFRAASAKVPEQLANFGSHHNLIPLLISEGGWNSVASLKQAVWNYVACEPFQGGSGGWGGDSSESTNPQLQFLTESPLMQSCVEREHD